VNRTRNQTAIRAAIGSAIRYVWRTLRACDLGGENSTDKRGVSNPRAGFGTESGKNRWVAHAPDLRSTMTGDDRRAAQNAARIDDDEICKPKVLRHLPPAVIRSLVRLVPMHYLGPGTPIWRQPPRFAAAPLAASAMGEHCCLYQTTKRR
jgi:hypothetical protein